MISWLTPHIDAVSKADGDGHAAGGLDPMEIDKQRPVSSARRPTRCGNGNSSSWRGSRSKGSVASSHAVSLAVPMSSKSHAWPRDCTPLIGRPQRHREASARVGLQAVALAHQLHAAVAQRAASHTHLRSEGRFQSGLRMQAHHIEAALRSVSAKALDAYRRVYGNCEGPGGSHRTVRAGGSASQAAGCVAWRRTRCFLQRERRHRRRLCARRRRGLVQIHPSGIQILSTQLEPSRAWSGC